MQKYFSVIRVVKNYYQERNYINPTFREKTVFTYLNRPPRTNVDDTGFGTCRRSEDEHATSRSQKILIILHSECAFSNLYAKVR